MSNIAIAWHYTTGQKFHEIVESRYLKPATAYVLPPEKPILWFSTHQYFEPTARKSVAEANGNRLLEVPELLERVGLFRFGVPVGRLLPWRDLKRRSRMSPSMAEHLESVGANQGANPSDWHGCLKKIHFSTCIIQVMNKTSGEWEQIEAVLDAAGY